MIDEISKRFELNLSRVQNLIKIYSQLDRSNKKNKQNGVHDSDILRAALVLLHASLEDFLRSLLIWKLPNSGKEELDKIPLLGDEHKRPSNLHLGTLVSFKGQKAEDIIRSSVEAYVEARISFNSIAQIKDALSDCGLDADGFNYDEIRSMVSRRHDIVHRADTTTSKQSDIENSAVNPISIDALKSYVKNVRDFERFIKLKITAVNYFPIMNPEHFENVVKYLIDNQRASRSDLISAIGVNTRRAGQLIRDLLIINLITETKPDKTIHPRFEESENASQILMRFCKNHSAYKEIIRNPKFSSNFTETQFAEIAVKTCSTNTASRAPTIFSAKSLLRLFWVTGLVTSKGDRLELSKSEPRPVPIHSASAFSRRQFNMFFGETPPPQVVSALQTLIGQKLSRAEAEKKIGKNNIYALVKFGLVSVDGSPSIPPQLRRQPIDEVVRLAASENHVIAFVCDLLNDEPNLAGVEIGDRVAEEYNCNWVRKSKQRNGAALGRWAVWVKKEEKKENKLPEYVTDVEKLVENLLKLDKKDYGTLIPSGRYSSSDIPLSFGRQAKVSKPMAQACKILRETHRMTMADISERVGVSRPAIYRAFDRYKLNSPPSSGETG